ncbi:DUF1735 domain-containing protein [Chitinophaga sancti]|uniref:DUF1735 domain-containing protein n=1 Tax=Chitinophaga sancti TaxID=1004 RepID=UPI003F7A68E5
MSDNKSAIYIALILIIVQFSCKKEDDPLTALARELGSYKYSYIETGSAIRLNGATSGNTTLTYRGFPVSLAGSASGETVVTATIDTSLIAAYNTLYNESNPSIDTKAFRPSFNGTFRIAANEKTAADSLYILLNDASGLENNTLYLVPVRLSANNGGKVATSVVFFKMMVTITAVDLYVNGGAAFEYTYPYARNGSQYWGFYLSQDEAGNVIGPSSLDISIAAGVRFPAGELHAYAVTDVSDSLINAFSAAAYTSYERFPEGTYSLTKASAVVAANTLNSSDSLKLSFSNYSAFKPGTFYLMGVKLVADQQDPLSAPPRNGAGAYALFSFYILQ